MDASSQEICCYRYHCPPRLVVWIGSWGNVPSVPSHSSYTIQRPLLGGGRPPDPPSCPNPCPCTAAYPTPGPLSQVNEINFENMSNDDAVRVLREIVHKPGYGWYGSLQRRGHAFWLTGEGLGLASTQPALTRDTLAFRPITLTVAKCWDPSPRGCFTLPRSKWMGDSAPNWYPAYMSPVSPAFCVALNLHSYPALSRVGSPKPLILPYRRAHPAH